MTTVEAVISSDRPPESLTMLVLAALLPPFRSGSGAMAFFLIIGACWVAAGGASAATIRYDVTGTISSVSDTGDLYGGLFQVGMSFTGRISYDTTIPDSDPDVAIGRYEADPARTLIRVSMSVAGVDITTLPASSDATILVRSDTDLFLTRVNNPGSTGPVIDALELLLSSSDDSTFTSDALPGELDLADFDNTSTLSFSSGFNPTAFVFGQIDTLTVPEPGTGTLLGLALLGLMARTRSSR